MMDIVRLRSFVVLAEDLHFGRAAARLGIAQPHLSRRIRELEDDVGAVLFERSQRRVVLSRPGAALLPRARRILDDLRRASDETRAIAEGKSGRLRIGFIHSSTYGTLPELLRLFAHDHPQVVLDLSEMTMVEQAAALVAGEIDVGILRPVSGVEGLCFTTIGREHFLLAVPDDWALAARQMVSLRDLATTAMIGFPQLTSPMFHARVTGALDRAGVTPPIVQEATQIHTVVGLVSAGLGVALVPEVAARLGVRGVRFLRISDGPEAVEVCIGARQGETSPAVQAFVRAGSQLPDRRLRDDRG
ncbi:LysR family transcriptional regulator [Phreatobacter sp.]|uniref:LysR family transcriptional regulator n=1 Tax=Phreatobacter sp. TaxID=1966341 RepID=UPI0022C59AB7|nr:LysR family transcriptional regulator [Phreatobacter sp.]MCZ8315715.1 LysR substrate-binding domain-containing protein [Phreatobacter sp.]